MNLTNIKLVAVELLFVGSHGTSTRYVAINAGVAQKNDTFAVSASASKTALAFFHSLLSLLVSESLPAMMGKLNHALTGLRIGVIETILVGDVVFLTANISGKHRLALRAPVPTNEPFTMPGVAYSTLRDGRITNGSLVADSNPVTKQIQF